MAELERLIVELAYNESYGKIPASVLDRAKLVILDTLGVAIRGNQTPYIRSAASALAPQIKNGSTLIALGRRSTAPLAALINASGTTTLELDETLRHGGGHCAVQVLPGAIAMAEQVGASGREVLTAFVCAYELGARLGKILSPFKSTLHPHGIWAAPAAALAASLVQGLRQEETIEAMRIACNLSITSSFSTAFEGATVRDFYAGFAAHNGLVASLLAREGVTGAKNAILSVLRPAVSQNELGDGLEEAFADFGKNFYIESNHLKPYAACFSVQAPIDAGLSLNGSVDPRNIERIDVYSTKLSARLARRDPQNALAAKFSIPYGVASSIIFGAAGPEEFSDTYVRQAGVQALSAKVNVFADKEITNRAPEKWGVRLEVFEKNGRKKVVEVEDTVGIGNDGNYRGRVERKFESLALVVYTERRIREIRAAVSRLDESPGVRSLTNLLA